MFPALPTGWMVREEGRGLGGGVKFLRPGASRFPAVLSLWYQVYTFSVAAGRGSEVGKDTNSSTSMDFEEVGEETGSGLDWETLSKFVLIL